MRYLIFIIACSLLFSCSDVFEADLDNSYTRERLYKDPAFAEGLLLNAYLYLPTTYDFNEVATDDAVTNVKNSNYMRMSSGEWSALFNPMDNWASTYAAIAYLNEFLSIVDEVEWSWESEYRNQLFKERYKGEALALRGYFHFILLMNFGGPSQTGTMMGIPYADRLYDSSDKSDWDISRLTYTETVNRILKDLNDASGLLVFDYTNNSDDADYIRVNGERHRGRMSGLIARAIMAKVGLHAASPAFNNGQYDHSLLEMAADTANVLISNAGGINKLVETIGIDMTLGDPYFYNSDNDIINTNSGITITDREVIWRSSLLSAGYTWEQDNLLPSRYGNGQVNPTHNLVEVFPTIEGYPINHPGAVYDPADPYKNRDPRLWNMVYYNGAEYSVSDKKIINIADDPRDGIGMQTNSTLTGYYMRKPLRVDVSLNPSAMSGKQHIRPYIRYTEIFLLFAEAANELWGPDADTKGYGYTAKDVIGNLRKRAGIATDKYLPLITTKQDMAELIKNERRIELSFEGFRFWDIRRWNMDMNTPIKGVEITRQGESAFSYKTVELETPRYASYMRFGPIPNAQILKSDVLTQNEGW